MNSQSFNYTFNISGNSATEVANITQNITGMNAQINNTVGIFNSMAGKFAIFNQASQLLQGFAQSLDSAIAPGKALNTSLADLSAISGATGESLKEVEGYARESAKTFGGGAAQSVESYKLLLSQLSPELTKTPIALKAMGDNVATLSKTMGGDSRAAAEVLTTAMNQYGVSLVDPIKASKEMAEMMNIMAAAGKEGSAELPTIKMALEQCGMAAKSAGVSFAETNAAIQVLDKAGKKGAEGGVALRNVMSILATGRFLPKDVQQELKGAGVNIKDLTDKSKSLTERLTPLKKVMNDSALFTKLFGRENSNAAMALVQGIPEVDRYSEAITGTNTAFDQATIVMGTYEERQSRVQAKFDDLKISLFNITGDMGIWAGILVGVAVPISQLIPLILAMGSAIKVIKGLNFASVLRGIGRYAKVARYQMLFLGAELRGASMASLGFAGNILRASFALVNFGTVGIYQGLKALGALIISLVTTGATSATFAGIASASFTAFKVAAVSACRAVGVAIMSIPIVGWIAAAIAALIAIGIYFWNTSAEFRAVLKGLWAAFKTVFSGIWDLAKTVFSGIGDLIKAAFSLDGDGIQKAINKLKGGFAEFGSTTAKAFNDAYNAEIKESAEEAKKKKEEEEAAKNAGAGTITDTTTTNTPGGSISGGLGGIGGKADKADKIKNINVTIDKLIGKFEIHTTNLHEDLSRVKQMVGEALTDAVNDVNYAR
ncbi:MAG: phage tail tape measure protein [Muribaculaceae bacterium]